MTNGIRYKTIDHTADIAIKAYGKTLAEAFGNAAFGMFDIIADISQFKPVGEFRVELEAPDLEQMLVDWLSELLYLSEVEDIIFCEFEVIIQDNELKGIARGEKYNPLKHELHTEIKAVTYHMLEIDKVENTVQVLFDI